MTQEEKQLLLKDLCGRLPYGVIVSYQVGKNTPVNRVLTGKALDELVRGSYVDEWLKCSFKPYLRPMSSMTEEERRDMSAAIQKDKIEPWGEIKNSGEDNLLLCACRQSSNMQDWLNSRHFDYRRLIEKGLALEAPDGMYKTK